MSTHKSQTLNLHLWEPNDDFLRTEFNENFTALDSAVKADRDSIKAEETARKSAVSSLQSSLSGKATTSALNTAKSDLLTKINEAQSTADAAQTAAGNAWSSSNPFFVLGNYVGSGETGSGSRTLELGFKPSCMIIGDHSGIKLLTPAYSAASCSVTWLSTGVKISGSGDPGDRFDKNGRGYAYIAFR